MRVLRGSCQRCSTVGGPEFFVAGAFGFAGEAAKFSAGMTTLEPPITAFLAIHDVMRKAMSTIRSRYDLLRA